MIGAVALHLALHGSWVIMMGKRAMKALRSREIRLSRGVRWNMAVNALVALSFAVTAVSGIYFLFAPSGGGGQAASGSQATWDLIHTWGGVALIAAAGVHLAIHWRWVKNVTRRWVMTLWPRPRLAAAEG
jgi:membrane protease YdiL (CAAX protease family)